MGTLHMCLLPRPASMCACHRLNLSPPARIQTNPPPVTCRCCRGRAPARQSQQGAVPLAARHLRVSTCRPLPAGRRPHQLPLAAAPAARRRAMCRLPPPPVPAGGARSGPAACARGLWARHSWMSAHRTAQLPPAASCALTSPLAASITRARLGAGSIGKLEPLECASYSGRGAKAGRLQIFWRLQLPATAKEEIV